VTPSAVQKLVDKLRPSGTSPSITTRSRARTTSSRTNSISDEERRRLSRHAACDGQAGAGDHQALDRPDQDVPIRHGRGDQSGSRGPDLPSPCELDPADDEQEGAIIAIAMMCAQTCQITLPFH
jgi:hypothetical protein